MGSKNPYSVSSKDIERHTARLTTAVTLGRVVGYVGEQVSTLGAAGFGVAIQNGAIGQDIAITTDGTEVTETGAAIASIGLPLTIDATGRVIPAVTTGHFIFARSMGTAAAAGEYIQIKITREGKV